MNIFIFNGDWGWGLGIGDWGLGPIPNPQSPIPNPHFSLIFFILAEFNNIIIFYIYYKKYEIEILNHW